MTKRAALSERIATVCAVEQRPAGESIAAACQRLSVTRATYYRWKSECSSRLAAIENKEIHSRLTALKQAVERQEERERVLIALVRTMSRVERQQAAVWVQDRFGVSQRFVKRTLGIVVRPASRGYILERAIAARMAELARAHPGFGYRRLAALLRQEGTAINHKRAAKLWRSVSDKLKRSHRRERTRTSLRPSPLEAPWPCFCWSLDVTHYRTSDYRRLEFLTIVDDFSRLCLALEPARTIRVADARRVLMGLFFEPGPPRSLRVDRQAAALLHATADLLDEHHVRLLVTQGKTPAENAYVESFHATLGRAFFGIYEFLNLEHARQLCGEWRQYYNEQRPHSSLDNQTPHQFWNLASEELREY